MAGASPAIALWAGADELALERDLGVDDLLVADPAFAGDPCRVTQRADECEFGRGVHVELAAAFQPPAQRLPRSVVLGARAFGVDAAEARREGVGEVGGLRGAEAARADMRRRGGAVVDHRAGDLPQPGLDAVVGG